MSPDLRDFRSGDKVYLKGIPEQLGKVKGYTGQGLFVVIKWDHQKWYSWPMIYAENELVLYAS